MNTKSILTAFTLSTLISQLSTPLHAQGSLTPPAGPPVASMKTLDQVEARTALVAGAPGVAIDGAGTITISQAGSYYLTKNLTISIAGAKGIVINSDGVHLDLNGFSLICTTVPGGHAITGTGSGVRIRNGTILGGTTVVGNVFTKAGWESGVSIGGRVSDLTVKGVSFHAVDAGFNGSVVERVNVNVCGGRGIIAVCVLDSTVLAAGGHGIVAESGSNAGPVVNNCSAEARAAGGSDTYGILAFKGVVSNSQGYSAGGHGILAETANNCSGESNGYIGLIATTANNCTGTSTSDTGLLCSGVATNCSGTATTGVGLTCTGNATNCAGTSISGSPGLNVTGTASFCRGTRTGGVAIIAGNAIGCTSGGGTITAPLKSLGTP